MCDIYNKSKGYMNMNFCIFIYLYVYACIYPFDLKMSHNLFRPLVITFILFYLLIRINAAVICDTPSSQQNAPPSPNKETEVHSDSLGVLLGAKTEAIRKQSLAFWFLTTLSEE